MHRTFYSRLPLIPLLLCHVATAAAPNRITYQGKDLFLNGLNLAWDEFANDIGPNPATPDLAHFEKVFQEMNVQGANSMRLWLHTTGQYSPAWDGHMVTGPGVDTIEDLRAILDLAARYDIHLMLCLWSFDMLRMSNGDTYTDRAYAILTKDANRQSYIDNSLIPMVKALKGHPAILCWEIFNEPEGMSNEHGWDFNRHVPMAKIQAFINTCAGAIRRTDPDVLISNGSWAFIAASDVGEGNFNYYTDERLIAAGGDKDGVLDFYMVHYYDWAGTERSPFHFPASHWGLDKPLVVAEFYPKCENCTDASHQRLYDLGYAGALGWSWTDVPPADLLHQIGDVGKRHPGEILLKSREPNVTLRTRDADPCLAEGVPVALQADPVSGQEIRQVTFYLNGQSMAVDNEAPFEATLKPTAGEHTLYAVGESADGQRRRSSVLHLKVGKD